MKKLLYILLLLFTVVASAQQPWYKYSPMDYAWKNVGNEGFSPAAAESICIAFSQSGEPYVTYIDSAMYGYATTMKFDGTNWVYVGPEGFTGVYSAYPSIAFSPSGQPYVAFQRWSTMNGPATVMKFDGSNWTPVGNPNGFSAGAAWGIDLAFSPSGVPYVAYLDLANNARATVMKFNGTTWVNVGNAGFSSTGIDCISLAFSPSGQPYVAYPDEGTLPMHEATVMKFDGTNWVYVGPDGFSAGATNYTSLAFSPIDTLPYVAYQEYGNETYKATVMKYDGTNWVYLGNEGFSAGEADLTSLAFSPTDGEPYVAYIDGANSNKSTVMKYDGTNWVNVGSAGFSDGIIGWSLSFAFNPSDYHPYVAYKDEGDSSKATVMKYDSVYVGLKEQQKSQFLLYPNPASDKITIETTATPTQSQLSILNLNGEEVLTRSLIKPKTQIDISNLSSGVYFMRLTSDKTVEVGKFVKD
jgi:hypothetical protein